MMVRLIKGKFYIRSDTSKILYVIGRDLICQCKGYLAHNHCKHQKAVIDYIHSGATVDIARAPVHKFEPIIKIDRQCGRVFVDQQKEWVQQPIATVAII